MSSAISVAGRVREPTSPRTSSSLSCIKRTWRFSKSWIMRRTRRFRRSSSRSMSLSSSSMAQFLSFYSAIPAQATASRRAFWIPRWPSTFDHHSWSAWAPSPSPPRPMVVAGIPSAMGTFASVDPVSSWGSTPEGRGGGGGGDSERDGHVRVRRSGLELGLDSEVASRREGALDERCRRVDRSRRPVPEHLHVDRERIASAFPLVLLLERPVDGFLHDLVDLPELLRVLGAHVDLRPVLERDGVHRGSAADAADVVRRPRTFDHELARLLVE